MNADRTALYRIYDAAGQLLYVGITIDPPTRFHRHEADQPWWSELARIDVVWYAERTLALQAEADAIISERPRYNIAGRTRHLTYRHWAAAPPLQPSTEATALDRVSRAVLARRLADGPVEEAAAEAALRQALAEASREVASLAKVAELLRS